MRLLFACAALVIGAGPADAAQRVLLARGYWAALKSEDGRQCQSAARSLRDAPKGAAQAHATLAFDAGRGRRGQFHVRLSRSARAGTSVMLTIGGQPFQLVARGHEAWSAGPAQEAAIIAAMRVASGMRVAARDSAGRRFADRYLLAGAPSAIDAAAAGCSRS